MDESDLSWLADLEQSVERAAGRLRELREENARLAARLAELEATAAESAGDAGDDDSGAAAWRRERKQVRARVESLAESLEKLL